MDDHNNQFEIEIPQYFLCPISLQIMNDPVTATTGITYDRQSIQHWLTTASQPICPVTKQPLEPVTGHHHLTPNHTLLRLIQAWTVIHGVDRIPTPKPPLTKAHVSKILRGLTVPHLFCTTLDQLLIIATSDDYVHDPTTMVDSGVVKAMVNVLINCHVENRTVGVEQAIRILTLVWIPNSDLIKSIIEKNFDQLINAFTWILNDVEDVQSHALALTKKVIKVTSSNLIERINQVFFNPVVNIIKQAYTSTNTIITPRGNDDVMMGPTKGAIRVLLEACKYGRNRYKIIEAGAMHELIELELGFGLDKAGVRNKLTELGFRLLAQLCKCAEGRAQLLGHRGGLTMVAKRMVRVSEVVDDSAVKMIGLLSKYSATKETMEEMVRVGVVEKLWIVLQSDRGKYLKDKVMDILRMHSFVWNKH